MAAVDDLAWVSAGELAALGIEPPAALAEALIPLWRSSPTAKYHWADKRSMCKHLPGYRWAGARDAAPPVSDKVPALGFDVPTSAVCTSCAAQIAISPHADAFVAVAAELARAEQWVQTGRSGAVDADWSWLRFARWKARQPLQGDRWGDAIKAVRGDKWSTTALALRGALAKHRQEAKAVTRLLAESIGDDPGRSALLERAIRMVETDSAALEESATVLQISGCRRGTDVLAQMYGGRGDVYEQPSPWHLVAGAWRDAKKRGVHVEVDPLAAYFDEQFPHVHNLQALQCCAFHDPPYVPGDCVHSWAVRTAQAHRRALIAEWVDRLEMVVSGLIATRLDTGGVSTHLLCMSGWPPTQDGMDAIAYLSQFEIVCGPYEVDCGRYSNDRVVVLRVPEWAAAHAAELSAPMPSEPITDERLQAIRLARAGGVVVVADEFAARRRPSALVTAARELFLHETTPSGYPARRRPLAPGSTPPPSYGEGNQWTRHSARYVLDGATFIYGFDDVELLGLALPDDRRSPIRAVAQVELQTGCRRSYHEDGPHMCDLEGIVEAVTKNGAVVFTAEGMREMVTIPSAYVAALSCTR